MMDTDNKLKVLYISHERKMGGGNLSLFDLVKEMKDRGHKVAVVVLFRGCPIDVRLREEGIESFPCFFGWWMEPGDWNVILKAAFRLLHWMQRLSVIRISSYVKREGFDIIHSNSSVIDIGAQVAARTGVRHIWHFREFGELHYHFEYMMGKDRSLKYVNDNADRVIFISKALEEEFSTIRKRGQVYDGIPDSSFYMTERNRNTNNTFVFVTTGVITRGKNQKVVLEAVNTLNNSGSELYYDGSYEVWIAGEATALSDSRRYKDELLRYIKNNNINNVRFLGFVSDMRSIREKADAEIIASSNEAYGRVTIEAMAAGNYVLASNSGSNTELVGNNERGMLFDNRDPKDLASKMRKILENRNIMSTTENNAYEYAREIHRMTASVDKIESIYREVIDE